MESIHQGGNVGYGVTLLDFRGPAISTVTAPVAGITTINIVRGDLISINTTAPSGPVNGDLWYSPILARTFIYYDESAFGYGSSAQWVDAAPFNVGILSAYNLTIHNNLDVSGVTTSSGGFVGNLTGNVTGDVTGDVNR